MRLESEILAFLHSELRCSRKEDNKILLQGLLFKKPLHTWKEFSKGTARVWKNKASIHICWLAGCSGLEVGQIGRERKPGLGHQKE